MSITSSQSTSSIPSRTPIGERWRGVAEALTTMTSCASGAALAETVQDVIMSQLGASDCAFIVFDQSANQFVFTVHREHEHPKKPTEDFDAFRAWLGTLPMAAEFDDCQSIQWPGMIPTPESEDACPVAIIQEEVDPALFNLLIVFGTPGTGAFTDDDLEVAQVLTTHAGLAVRHVLREENARREVMGRTALYEVGKRISSSLATDEVLKLIIDSLQRVVPYDAAVIFMLEPELDRVTMKAARGYSDDADALVRIRRGDGISGWAAQTGLAVIVPDVRADERYVKLRDDTMSEMVVPLMKGQEVIGVFNIESNRLEAYDDSDRALLESFASQAAVAIENARLYEEALRTRQLEKELQVAGDIQRMLMPRKFPSVPGLSITVYHEQCMEVGGDFYDAFALSHQYVAMAVGDVAGKGVPGAITMASLYTVFHEYATDALNTPSDVMSVVNQRLHEGTATDLFATLFYGVLNLNNGNMHYCNAGHPPPIVCRADGSISLLDTGGLILGPFPDARFEDGTEPIVEGDVLVLYTDGVIEARNESSEEFGIDGLKNVLRTCSGLSAEEVKVCLTNSLRTHTGGSTHHDDVTIITMRVTDPFHAGLRVE